MEVHHHPDLHHKKKHWKEYFLEFLMIFLAVTMGFFAESYREHLGDISKENEYIRSVVEDLKSDTLQANDVIAQLKTTRLGLDTLLEELSSDQIYTNSNNARKLWNRYMGFADFVSNDRTIQQMKSSGSLRLIRNRKVSDEIMNYDETLKQYYSQDGMMNGALADQSLYSRLFDFIALKKNQDKPVPLTAQGKTLLNEAYANRLVWKRGLGGCVYQLQMVIVEAKKLSALIKEQYRIE